MERHCAVRAIVLLGFGGWTAACALRDVFRPGGLEPVLIAFRGDTMIVAGDTVPFSVDVCVGNARLPNPLLDIALESTGDVLLTSGGDSLVGVRSGGQADLTIRLLNSIFTDTVPTLVQRIKVNPNPQPPAPGCTSARSP